MRGADSPRCLRSLKKILFGAPACPVLTLPAFLATFAEQTAARVCHFCGKRALVMVVYA